MMGAPLREILVALGQGLAPKEIPPDCEYAEELRAIVGQFSDIRRLAGALGRGELDLPPDITSKGSTVGSLKALNAALRHLTWQTQRVAEGDFSQRVDFLGEFSSAFNHMVGQLKQRALIEGHLRHAQKLEAVGQLAAGLAHEINTPAQVLTTNLDFLRECINTLSGTLAEYRTTVAGLAPPEDPRLRQLEEVEVSRDLGYIEEEAPAACSAASKGIARIAAIVAAMKDFAQAERTEREPTDLNRALAATLLVAESRYHHLADAHADYGPIPPVPCYPAEVNQAFLALITNAWMAIEDLNRPGERGVIGARTFVSGESVVIELSDTGCGIPQEIRERVFEPFFTTRVVGRGTGLGLSIVHSIIVDKHGGRLSFDSLPGRGTTFRIELPVKVA